MKAIHQAALNILILLIGPVLTTAIYVTSETESFLFFVALATVLLLIALLVSIPLHVWIKRLWLGLLASVVAVEIVYVVLLLCAMWWNPEAREFGPFIAVLFLVPCTLPTALSVAVGVGRMIKLLRAKRNCNRPR